MIAASTRKPLRVAVFDDSPTMRAAIRGALESNGMNVVVEAASGKDAARIVAHHCPDVVVMGVVMSDMNGYEAARSIMDEVPTPIVMVSGVGDPRDSEVIFAALSAGALHVAEPPPDDAGCRHGSAAFAAIVRSMAGARLRRDDPPVERARPPTTEQLSRARRLAVDVIGIVASTGGPQALTRILGDLPRGLMPPILLIQHLAPGFTASFIRWLGDTCGQTVELAVARTKAQPGVVYLAPEDRHLALDSAGRLVVSSARPVGGFRPSGTYLLRSLAFLGARALGVVLTGMGSDGAEGAATMRAAGGLVAVQDRGTSTVYGMPAAALALAGADAVLPLPQVASWLRERSGLS